MSAKPVFAKFSYVICITSLITLFVTVYKVLLPIKYNNQEEREIAQERNAKQFKKWFDQGVPEMKELIAKNKDVHIVVDGTTDTIQGDINGKFIRDCFIVFLNRLANNTADTYKFIKPVSGVNPFK